MRRAQPLQCMYGQLSRCKLVRKQRVTALMQAACNRRAALYPERFAGDGNDGEADAPVVRFADVGCGFGGLLIRLSPLYPDKLMIGFELRDKVRRRWPLAPLADCLMVRPRFPTALAAHQHRWVLTVVRVRRRDAAL